VGPMAQDERDACETDLKCHDRRLPRLLKLEPVGCNNAGSNVLSPDVECYGHFAAWDQDVS